MALLAWTCWPVSEERSWLVGKSCSDRMPVVNGNRSGLTRIPITISSSERCPPVADNVIVHSDLTDSSGQPPRAYWLRKNPSYDSARVNTAFSVGPRNDW